MAHALRSVKKYIVEVEIGANDFIEATAIAELFHDRETKARISVYDTFMESSKVIGVKEKS